MTKRKKSFLWEFFDPVSENKASCNLCKHDISYKTSTSNLKKHIERKHPILLTTSSHTLMNEIESDTETPTKEESTNAEPSENPEENIFIEYCVEDNIDEDKTSASPKWKTQRKTILKPSSDTPNREKLARNDLNSKISSLANSRSELIRTQIEAAKKDLEVKELQLVYARREDERRRREHEITMKIKQAQLHAILSEAIVGE